MKKYICLLAGLLAAPAFADRTVGTVVIRGQASDAACAGFTPSANSLGVIYTCIPAVTPPTPPPAGAPTGCVARINGSTANVALTSSGGTTAMSATCSTPSSGITWNWIRNGTPGFNTSASWTATFPANASSTVDVVTSFQLKACVSALCATVPTAPMRVTVPHTGGGSWAGTCPGFDNTVVIDFTWASPGRLYTGTFGVNDIAVGRFTTGSVDSPNNNLPRITAAEWTSPPSNRYAVLSATPCDFSLQAWQGATSAGTSVQVPFAVGTGNNFGFYPILQKNTTYYFNVKNLSTGESCSSGGDCQMFIELGVPGGM